MENTNELRIRDLEENPTPRVPVCLVLDTSGSMYGNPIRELNEGVKLFFKSIGEDDIAKYAAEIAVVTFGGDKAQVLLDFDNIERQQVPVLSADGLTPMGEAVEMALKLLDDRKKEYSDVGVEYFQPWLVLMTDGCPTDDISNAASSTTTLINNKRLTLFPIGIGSGADMNVLKSFSPKMSPARLKGLEFGKLFEWLSQSVISTSVSTPGEVVKLPDPSQWMELSL